MLVLRVLLGIQCCNLLKEVENKVTSLIFDMDGTLFQTDKILELSLEDTFNYLRELHLWDADTPLQMYRNIMGAPLPVVWETLLPNQSDSIRFSANEYFHGRLIENINAGRGALYPNVIELFNYLKQNNCNIFIASNGQIEYLKSIIDFYHLDQWVTETFSIQQIKSQNKSDLVKEIMSKYDIKIGAVIGDRLSDVQAAKSNGLYAIGCDFDFAKLEELVQADTIISNFVELEEFLNSSRLVCF